MSYLEERIKRTGKKEAPAERVPMSAKERIAKDKPSKTAKDPAASKPVDVADAPKPDLTALRAMARQA